MGQVQGDEMTTKQTKTVKPRIERIWIEIKVDTDPDTSFLGEYTDEVDAWHIDRQTGEYIHDLLKQPLPEGQRSFPERGREFRFFKPYAGGEKPGTDDYKKYGLADFKRMEDLCRGDWCFVGITAKAEVRYPISTNCQRITSFQSGGLWGVESDSKDYHKDVAAEELAGLKSHLEVFGVNLRGWKRLAAEALENIEYP
jgi:hypothetical protein